MDAAHRDSEAPPSPSAHTQGCMYLAPFETRFCSAARAMDLQDRVGEACDLGVPPEQNWSFAGALYFVASACFSHLKLQK